MAQLPRPVHLYIKTHKTTGLKYFGRTVEDPSVYQGSGAYWTRHLAKYGNDVSTQIVGTYHDDGDLRAAAQIFSSTNRIADSTDWANLLPENGDEAGEGWNPTAHYASRIAALDASMERRFHSGHDVGVGTSDIRASRAGSYANANAGHPASEVNWWAWFSGIAIAIGVIWVFAVSSHEQERTAENNRSQTRGPLGSVTCWEQSRDCWGDAVPSVIGDLKQTDPVLWRDCNSAAWDAFDDSWANGAAGTPPTASGSATVTIGRCEVEVTLEPGAVHGVFTRLAA